jgi:acetyltransferase-like isoleucine patch superfamily enzyme
MARVTVTWVVLAAGAVTDRNRPDHATLGEEGDKVEEKRG